MFPRNQNMKKKPFCTSSNNIDIKDKDMMWNCVFHSKIKPIDDDGFFYRKVVIDVLGSNLNDNDKIEESIVP